MSSAEINVGFGERGLGFCRKIESVMAQFSKSENFSLGRFCLSQDSPPLFFTNINTHLIFVMNALKIRAKHCLIGPIRSWWPA